MKAKTFEHGGLKVKIPAQEDAKRMRLTINGEAHWFGRDAAGAFFLHKYAYDRSKDLTKVIKNYLDHHLDHQEQEHNSSQTAKKRD